MYILTRSLSYKATAALVQESKKKGLEIYARVREDICLKQM